MSAEPSSPLALSSNLPEPVSYRGRHFVNLPIAISEFSPAIVNDCDWAVELWSPDDAIDVAVGADIPLETYSVEISFLHDWSYAALFQTSLDVRRQDGSPTGGLCVWLGGGNIEIVTTTAAGAPRRVLSAPLGVTDRRDWVHLAYTVAPRSLPVLTLTEGSSQQQISVAPGVVEGTTPDDDGGEAGPDEGEGESTVVPTPPASRLMVLGPGRTRLGGRPGWTPGRGFDLAPRGVQIDSFRLWSRPLGLDEINNHLGLRYVNDRRGLLMDYTFDEGTGTSVSNRAESSLGLGGTVRGARWTLSTAAAAVSTDTSSIRSFVESALTDAIDTGRFDPRLFRGELWLVGDDVSDAIRAYLGTLDPAEVERRFAEDEGISFFFTTRGRVAHRWVPLRRTIRPEFALVETYRMSVYRGAYGPGRIVGTMSLLPGESTEISISTFKKFESTRQSASSVLESSTKSTTKEFREALDSESTSSSTDSSTTRWSADVAASASGGVGVDWSVNASASAGGEVTANREALAKHVSTVASQQAQAASNERTVEVNTNLEVRSESEDRTEIVRRIENINVSRTLNYVFRQMNQEYIRVLHLVDVDIAFRLVGNKDSVRIVPLAELDDLLVEVIQPGARERVRRVVLDAVSGVRDYAGLPARGRAEPHPSFVVPEAGAAEDSPTGYHRIDRHYTTLVSDAATGSEIVVPGVVIDVGRTVMQTDHVYADAFLGTGDALDDYSRGLQNFALRREEVEIAEIDQKNQLATLQQRITDLAVKAFRDRDMAAAELHGSLFGPHRNGDD